MNKEKPAHSISMMSLLVMALLWALCSLWATEGVTQELTPRAYWPAPHGTKVLVTGYSYLDGDVLIDPSLPVDGVDSQLNVGVLAYAQTLGLFGRTSNLIVELPYLQGTSKGFFEEQPVQRDLSGFGDLSVALTFNLRGAPSMTLEEFRALRANPRPILGASIKVVVPTGNYNDKKLINVGTNRWAVRAQLGSIIPLKPTWLLELSAGAWFYGDDDEFLTGKRDQGPVYSAQANIIKRVRPGFWASLDFTYYSGGRQTIAGQRLDDLQKNTKIGGTLVIPFRRRHAIKFGYANGAITKSGNDFNQILVSYQVLL